MQNFKSSDGLNIAFTDEGPRDGLPILCLSGLTRNSRDFDYVLPHFPQHRWIRMDYRGRGASDWAPDFKSYNIATEARDAVELLDHLGIGSVSLLGTSRGGLIGMALAATARDRLRGVCLNDVGPSLDSAGLEVIAQYIGKPVPFDTAAAFAEYKQRSMTDFRGVPMERWLAEAQHQTIVDADGLKLAYDPKLADAFRAASALPVPDLWPLYDALKGLPTLIIRAANSNLLAPETVQEMLRRVPDAKAVEIADRGHVPFLDEPDALAAIEKWLSRCL